MHEEMSFKIDVSRDQESRIQKFQEEREIQKFEESLRSKISNDGMSGDELIGVRKMVIFGCCVQTVRRGRRRELIFRKSW